MSRYLASIIACVAAFCAQSAPAAERMNPQIENFAKCLADRRPARIAKWVKADGPYLMWREIKATSVDAKCNTFGGINTEYWTFRGALAQTLFLKRVFDDGMPDFNLVSLKTEVNEALANENPEHRTFYLVNAFTECMAQKSGMKLVDLLKSPMNSNEEILMMAHLEPEQIQCRLYAGNVELDTPLVMLRAKIAIAAYLLSEDPLFATKKGGV